MSDDALRAEVAAWIADDPHAGDRAELADLLAADDLTELRDRFAAPLAFGTAGLRGPLRAGPNGMNLAVVRRTTAGLSTWVRAAGRDGGVVVGYDARRRSQELAHDAAATLAGAGLVVHLADRPWPTPVTAFAVAHLGAAAGIQVTASHNPAGDNGYKVYDHTGAQIVAPDDTTIADAIRAQPGAATIATAPVAPTLGDAMVGAYATAALGVLGGLSERRDVRIVYTPLYGVGGALMLDLFAAAGFDDVHPVAAELAPDSGFGGLPFPNPEEVGVLDGALALAAAVDADLLVANDPDADRLAIGVRSPVEGWRRLSGDELGLWLADLVLDATAGDDAPQRVVARSRVSATALDRLAARRGVECAVTPTGFKWLSRVVDGRAGRLVFAYEEALGYAVSPIVRDKDGLTAALVAAAGAATEPPLTRLARIGVLDGVSVTTQWAPRFEGPGALERMHAAMARLGAGDPIVVEVGGGVVQVRPSGTEPKLKCYIEVVVTPADDSVAAYEAARRSGLEQAATIQAEIAARLAL